MGVTLSDASPKQARILANVPKITSFMSMLGSCYIMVDIIRLPKRTIYHRLVFWMNVCDFMSLTAWFMTTWPIPKSYPDEYDIPIYNAVGNQRTCNMQGFLGQMSIGTVFYSGCLMCYFMLAIKYGWKEKKINDAHVEKIMHSLAFVLTVGTAVAALLMDLYNPVGWECWIGSVPQGCSDGWDLTLFEDISECDRGANANFFLWWFFYFPLWLTILGASVAVGMVYSAFWKAEKKAEKWKMKGKQHPAPSNNSMQPSSGSLHDSQHQNGSRNETDSEIRNSAFEDSCLNTTALNESYLNSAALNDSGLNSSTIDDLNNSSPNNNISNTNSFNFSGGDSVGSKSLEQSSSRSLAGSLRRFTNPKSALKGAAKVVRKSYKKGRDKLKGISEREEDEIRRRKKKAKRTKKQRLVISQAFLYAGSFYVAWFFPSLLRIHEVTGSSDEGIQYHWVILSACFVPLQGLMNFIIYIRPKYIRISAERKKKRLRRIKELELRERLNLPTETKVSNPLRKKKSSKKTLQRDISKPRLKSSVKSRRARLSSLRQFSGVSLSSSDDMPSLSVYGGSESGGSAFSSGDSQSQLTSRAGSSKSLTRGGSSKELSVSTCTFFDDEGEGDLLKRSNHDLPPLIEPQGGSSSFAFDSEEIQLVMEQGEKKSLDIEPPFLEEDEFDSKAEDSDSEGPPPLDENDEDYVDDNEDYDDDENDAYNEDYVDHMEEGSDEDDGDGGPPPLDEDAFSEDEVSSSGEDSELDGDGRNIHMFPPLLEMDESGGSISVYRDEGVQNEGNQAQDKWEKARAAFHNSASSMNAGNMPPPALVLKGSDSDSEKKRHRRGDRLSKSSSQVRERERVVNPKRSRSQPRAATKRIPRRTSGKKVTTNNTIPRAILSRGRSLESGTRVHKTMMSPPRQRSNPNLSMPQLIPGKTLDSQKGADNNLFLTMPSVGDSTTTGTNDFSGKTVVMPPRRTSNAGKEEVVTFGRSESGSPLLDSESDSEDDSASEGGGDGGGGGGGYFGNIMFAIDNAGGTLNLAVDNPRTHDDDNKDENTTPRRSAERRNMLSRGWRSFRNSRRGDKSSPKESQSERGRQNILEDVTASKRRSSAHNSLRSSTSSAKSPLDLSRRSKMKLARSSNGSTMSSSSSRMNLGRSVRNFATDFSTTLMAASRESDWLDHLDGLVSEDEDDEDDDDDMDDLDDDLLMGPRRG